MAVKIIAQHVYSDKSCLTRRSYAKSCKIRTGPKWDGKRARRL